LNSKASMTLLLYTILFLYAARLVFFFVGAMRSRRGGVLAPDPPFVSVIVPARNEETNLPACLASLAATDWPMDRWEVLVVNDRSTDRTPDIIDDWASRHDWLKPLHRSDDDAIGNLRGKPGALQAGIAQAKGSILLFTDADCTIPSTWIASMVSAFDTDGVGMVCGTTVIRTRTAPAAMQDVEWTLAHALARAGLSNGVPLGCFGNNMAIRASVYEAVGGYAGIPFSVTEDLALLLAVHGAGHTVRYLCDPSSTIETLPCETMGEYVRQRKRWAIGGTALGWRAALFVGSSLALWIGLVMAATIRDWAMFTTLAVMRLGGDSGLVLVSQFRMRRATSTAWVVPTILLLLLTELALPFLIMRRKVVWKNQQFTG
jgi:1,2-diacylglycerol 3-beta-glucosyltransferase